MPTLQLLFGLVALFIGGAGATAAAETGTNLPAFVIKSWQTIDGLPQNSVTAIAQTPDGYLWIGTRGGLARFDGVHFRNYGLADGLKGLSIRALIEDGQGGLWIATRGGGLSRWRDGVITTMTTADGLAHNDVLAIAPAEPGAVWIGTWRGLQHWGPDGFKQVGEAEGVRGPVYGMAASPTEGLWFNVEDVGLFRCQSGRCEFVEPVPKSRHLFPSSFFADAEGTLWIGMGNGVVLRRQAGAWKEFNQTNGVPFSYIYCFAQGSSGEIWAGSHEGGLHVFRAGGFHAVSGLDAAIRSIHVSKDGVAWVGTQTGGLSRLTRAQVTSYPVMRDTKRGQVNGLVEDPPGQFWVTVYGGGLFRGTLDALEPELSVKELVNNPFMSAGLKMRDGTVFIAGQKRLWRKEAGTEKFNATVLAGNPRALCEDESGSLWLGTYEGELKRLVDGAPQAVANGTFPAAITGLVPGKGPALWVATQGAGLFRWEAGQVQRWTTAKGLPTGILLSLYPDADGTLWIGTAGGGLAWLEGGRVQAVNSRQGLGGDVISQILSDDLGNLWLGGNHGISRVSKRELRAVSGGESAAVHPLLLDESDGMLTAECTGGYSPAGWASPSGTLYFSTVRGVVAVDPAQFGPSANPPTVRIEEVKLNGKPVAVRDGALTLPSGSRDLEIFYTAFNYAKPEQIRFRHRLQGEDWGEAEKARSIRYSQLPPGEYTFEVNAANPDLRWQPDGASLAFVVQPFVWQTAWFRAGAAVLLISLGGGAAWWRARRRHRQELVDLERTRRQQAEMAHLSRVSMLGELSGSLAHELNQPLTAILSNAQAAQRFLAHGDVNLDELREILSDIVDEDKRAGEVIRRLRLLFKKGETQSQPLDVNEVVQEVLKLTRSDLLNQSVTVQIELAPDLPAVRGDRVQLQQVVLNLVMNACDAMQAAPAGERRILLRTELAGDEGVRVSLADGGSGVLPEQLEEMFQPFFTTKAHGMGLGLSICRTIITAHGGKLWATRNPECGATFHFTLPANNDEDS